ncbi:MAG: porin [Syntrophales bacterium LBB04]|nr:porin [Syntrophales bacterium LBB04]
MAWPSLYVGKEIKDKSYGLSIGVTQAEVFSASLNVMYGPEQDNNTGSKRTLYDIVATIKPVKKLAFIVNGDYGQEDNAVATGTAKWTVSPG